MRREVLTCDNCGKEVDNLSSSIGLRFEADGMPVVACLEFEKDTSFRDCISVKKYELCIGCRREIVNMLKIGKVNFK